MNTPIKHKIGLLRRVAKFITGKTPGLKKANEAAIKRDSDKISASEKARYSAKVNFCRAKSVLTECIEENVTLNKSALEPKEA